VFDDLHDLLQPRHEVLHVEGAFFEQLDHAVVDSRAGGGNGEAVDPQEDIDYGKRDPLVPIDERMVLNEALEERRRLVDERVVVAGLRAVQRRARCVRRVRRRVRDESGCSRSFLQSMPHRRSFNSGRGA
jgi:hypothetical protein